MVKLEFVYEPDDLNVGKVAKKLMVRNRGRLRRGLFGSLLFMGLLVMLFTLLQHQNGGAPAQQATNPPPGGLLEMLLNLLPWLVVFGFIWWILFFTIRRNRGKSLLKQNPSLQERQIYTFSDAGVLGEAGFADSHYRWPIFSAWDEPAQHFALRMHQETNRFLIIPKRAANAEQQAELRQLFNTNIKEPTKGFPVFPVG